VSGRADALVLAGLDVLRVPASAPRRRGALLCVHGLWGSAWVWERWLDRLAGHGWDGYALNLRGRGARPEDVARVRLADHVADVAAVARELGDVVVVGHSMGGLLAQALATSALPRAVVAVTPAAPRGIWPLRTAALTAATLRHAPRLVRGGSLLPGRSVMRRVALHRLSPAERERAYARLVPESTRVVREVALGALRVPGTRRCPMLVIGAAHDRITPPAVVRRVARRYGAELYEYADFAHMVPLEPGGERVAGDVARWLDAVVPG
jgi:pimeloyl-ACP methyl ester carboxylesterase